MPSCCLNHVGSGKTSGFSATLMICPAIKQIDHDKVGTRVWEDSLLLKTKFTDKNCL